MGLLQKLKCWRCPCRPQCLLMEAVLARYDQWEKTEKPKLDAVLKSADELLRRMELEKSSN